jgi:lysozyme
MKAIRTMSERGLKWLKSFENCSLTAYKDIGGVWTIGYGHTEGVISGMKISPADADRLFAQDVKNIAERYVNALPEQIKLTQNQFDALCFLVFNTGPQSVAPGTTIRNALLAGDYEKAAQGFMLWVKIRDKKSGKLVFCQGLYNRRKRESAYFQGKYDQIKESLAELA